MYSLTCRRGLQGFPDVGIIVKYNKLWSGNLLHMQEYRLHARMDLMATGQKRRRSTEEEMDARTGLRA